jgi:hypothetical protein
VLPQRAEKVYIGRVEGKDGGEEDVVGISSDTTLHLKISLPHGRQMKIYNILHMAMLKVEGKGAGAWQ